MSDYKKLEVTSLAKDTLSKEDVQDKMNKILANFKGEKHELVPILQETQEEFNYYLPRRCGKSPGS